MTVSDDAQTAAFLLLIFFPYKKRELEANSLKKKIYF